MNTGTRHSTDTAVLLMLPPETAIPYCTGQAPARLPTLLPPAHHARRHWLEHAESMAIRADTLITLHIGSGPPSWFHACPQALQDRLAAWRPGRLVHRTLCCDSLGAALLTGHWLLTADASSPDAGLAALRRGSWRRLQWHRSVIPGLWTVRGEDGRTRFRRDSGLQRQLGNAGGRLALALRADGGFWFPALDSQPRLTGVGGTWCSLQVDCLSSNTQ